MRAHFSVGVNPIVFTLLKRYDVMMQQQKKEEDRRSNMDTCDKDERKNSTTASVAVVVSHSSVSASRPIQLLSSGVIHAFYPISCSKAPLFDRPYVLYIRRFPTLFTAPIPR